MMQDCGSNPCSLVNIEIAYIAFAIHSPKYQSWSCVKIWKPDSQGRFVIISPNSQLPCSGTPHSHTNRGYQILTQPKIFTNCPKCLLTPVLFPKLQHHVFR